MSFDSGGIDRGTGGGGAGTPGASAYELWLEAGNSGTVDEFLASLVGPAGADGADGAGGGTGRLSPVICSSGNANVGFNAVFSDGSAKGDVGGSFTAQNSRDRYTVRGDVGVVQFPFANFLTSTNYDTVCPNDFYLTASFETSDGRIIPLEFDGRRELLMPGSSSLLGLRDPLCIRLSDPLSADLVTDGFGYVHTYVRVDTLGKVWPTYPSQSSGLSEGILWEAAGTDRTLVSGSPGSVNGARHPYKPLYMVAHDSPSTMKPTVISGDSVVAGQTSYLATGLDAAKVPFWNAARNGDSAAQHGGTGASSRNRMTASRYARNAVINYLVNDLSSAFTAAQQQANLTKVIKAFQRRGMHVVYCTPTPKVRNPANGSDMSTVNGQVLFANEQVRLDVITWLRTLPLGIEIFDVAAVVAGISGDPSRWPANWSSDGTHPDGSLSATAISTMATAVDASKLLTA